MKIIEKHQFYNSDHDDASHVEIELITDEGKYNLSLGESEPEDNYLFRDLNDVYFISDLINKAYEAGKRGEEFEYKLIEERDE